MYELKIPSVVTVKSFARFFQNFNEDFNKINELESISSVRFDLTNTSYLEPISMAFLAAAEDKLRSRGLSVSYYYENDSKISKILRIFGMTSKATNLDDYYERNMSDYSVKLTRIKDANQTQEILRDILPKILKRVQNCSDIVQAGINWALGEIIDNAGNHGYSSYEYNSFQGTVYTCAFAYKDKVEICVYDLGQGIPKSLKNNNKELIGKNDKQILEQSLNKGVTGHPDGSPGFGLYASAKIAEQGGGALTIFSDGVGVTVSSDSKKTFSIQGFKGTLVSLSLNSGANFALKNIINRSPQDFFEDFEVEYNEN